MQISHLSYSSVNKFRGCPRSWKFRYIDGIKGKKSEALTVGSIVHEIIESFVQFIHGEEFESLEANEGDLDKIYYQTKRTYLEKHDDEELSDESDWFISEFLASEIREILKSFVPATNEAGDLAIEERVEFEVPGVSIPVIGYLDLITSDNQIVDFKTSKRSWNQDRADNELQASFYATALYLSGRVPYDQPITINYIVMVKNKKTKIQHLTTTRTADDIQLVFNTTSEIWKAIQKEAFFPNASAWLCSSKYCDAWNLCQGGKIL